MNVSVEEYNTTGFEPCDDAQRAKRALDRAFLLIDIVTGGRCADSDGLSEERLAALKRAVYAQTEQYVICEDFDYDSFSRVEIGDYAYTTNYSGGGVGLCALARALLTMNGLLSAVTEVR